MARKHHEIMRALATEIVSGARAPGEMLPREVDLAAEFGVSRGVARETIRAMEERRLITVKHGRGATVNGAESWDVFDVEVLAEALAAGRGADALGDFLECRRILEVAAARMAAERAGAADLERMEEALARMERTVALPLSRAGEDLFHQADVDFHRALIEATGNRPLASLEERLHSSLLVARYPLSRPHQRRRRAMPEHRRILAAVAAGDPDEAGLAMREHLETIGGYLAELGPGPRPNAVSAASSNGRLQTATYSD
ncbi:MAG: FadR/GntR family transcriptional regulator [Solirubrobacterales bacterium]